MALLRRIAGLPGLRDLAEARRLARARRASGFVMEARPGHFSSPIPALAEVRAREDQIFAVPSSLPGIDLRPEEQLRLVAELATCYPDQPFAAERQPGLRYFFDNDLFSYGDALVLHAMLRTLRPRRLVEVGSGYSSAVILDTAERFLGDSLSCTFVDPYPARLRELLRGEDSARHSIVTEPVQSVDLAVFDQLGDGDILFVDSTHVAKVGSDVNRLVFDVLPRLATGVVVHFHDIFYPFEYPKEWVYKGRAWNECYVLRSFLSFNDAFEIMLFNSYLAHFHADEVTAAMPLWGKKPGGSLWLRRLPTVAP